LLVLLAGLNRSEAPTLAGLAGAVNRGTIRPPDGRISQLPVPLLQYKRLRIAKRFGKW
jgi:hypothetical protein